MRQTRTKRQTLAAANAVPDAPEKLLEAEVAGAEAMLAPPVAIVQRKPSRTEYEELVVRARELVESCVPEGATVAVVSRGDTELLRFEGRTGWHLPRTTQGVYAGHHPADDTAAIAQLEAARAGGASYLLLPATAFWWLDHYAGFKRHMEAHYRRVADRPETAIVFSLLAVPADGGPRADRDSDVFAEQVRAVASALLPVGARVLVATSGDDRLLDLGGPIGWHFPQLEGGAHSGIDPATSSDAVAHLEALRMTGAEFLLFPRTGLWWLEHYAGLRQYLRQTYSLVSRQANVCTIYDLREELPYEELVEAVRRAAVSQIPKRATVLVASQGDPRLLELSGRHAWHFPQTGEREYAGRHPADDAEAITLLEELRAQGAGYLVLPRTLFWWVARYGALMRHLESNYMQLRGDPYCIVYDLAISPSKMSRDRKLRTHARLPRTRGSRRTYG